jgi:hypothetical protein
MLGSRIRPDGGVNAGPRSSRNPVASGDSYTYMFDSLLLVNAVIV